MYVLRQEGRRTYWATGGPPGGYSNHVGSNERRSRGLGEFYLTMLHVPTYTHERRPYSVTSYPTSFILDSLLALTIGAQRKIYGRCSTPGPMAGGDFLAMCGCSRDTHRLGVERGRGRNDDTMAAVRCTA